MPVPGKPEAPKKVIKCLLCIQKDMKLLNADVESMIAKGECDKYALRGNRMQASSLEAELVNLTREILSPEEVGKDLIERR